MNAVKDSMFFLRLPLPIYIRHFGDFHSLSNLSDAGRTAEKSNFVKFQQAVLAIK